MINLYIRNLFLILNHIIYNYYFYVTLSKYIEENYHYLYYHYLYTHVYVCIYIYTLKY